MALKKVIEIDVDVLNAQGGIASLGKTFEDVEKNTKSLKAQLREAITEVQQMNEKFGETSKEAINAAKRAAELKDKIEDANDAVQAFKGEGTFLATSKALSSVASGFGAVQGAMGLIGVESKDVQEQLLKVQSAMAVADGLAGLEDAGRSFKQLATVAKSYTIVQKAVTAAQWLWNAAMSANPIGAIVVVVTALIAAGYALVKMFMDSSEATKKAEKANIELNKSLDNQVKAQNKANQETELSSEHQLKMAKASGKSANEIRKLSVELANQEVAQKYANAQTLRAIAIEALRVAGLEDATEAQKETAKKALEAFNKANDDLKTSILNRRKLILDNRVAERQEQTDADKKAKEEADKKAEENKKEAEKKEQERRKDERKKQLDAINEQAKTIQENSQKIADEKLKKDIELKKKADEILKQIDAELAPEETPQQKLQREYEERLKILTDAGASTLALDAKYATDSFLLEQKLAADKKALKDKELADEKALQAQKLNTLGVSFGKVSELLGKNSKAGKAFAISQALINTYQGITAELATKTATPFEFGVKLVNIASVVGIGFKAVKDILKTPEMSTGGGGVSAPSGGGGAGGASAPTFNVVGNAGVNQIATTLGKEQPPVQAFVVSKQMTNQQEMDRNIVKNATL
jgi:hypothetical protein